jgi:hypothetical protein
MPDLLTLFPGFADQLPSRDGAQRPIGRRRARRPKLLRPKQLSPTLVKLNEITRTLGRLEDLFIDVGAALEKLASELQITTHERRQTNEKIAMLLRQHTELRRDLKATELHIPLRHSRRKPLG